MSHSTITPQQITVLGSTGSIGVSTLDVIARHPDRFRVFALTAQRQVERLLAQAIQFHPRYLVMVETQAAADLRQRLAAAGLADIEVLSGAAALVEVAADSAVDTVMAAIVGAAGLPPVFAAATCGKRILLANKEALVVAGDLLMQAVRRHGATLLPIDSEHNAIFQSMPSNFATGLDAVGVSTILLTASGGPFRNTPLAELATVTVEQAVAHPNWSMGRKISVDSATMMNKGLELIEACWLFNATPEQIEVVIHPESVIHSLVQYIDGSVLAQLGNPDMRTPIAHALAWPSRMLSGVKSLNLFEVAALHFSRPDYQRFPALSLCCNAMRQGGTTPTILNAANEIAVAAFLQRQISFTTISAMIDATLQRMSGVAVESLEQLLAVDGEARHLTTSLLASKPA
ncbi:MAG: 1-deoxy-D-xylulose-5-phosphate reductoisomerase [Gammaproteobacteria bacterium]|nr:1-deoxy-D-xylulose-5-phosphate reductoisomerase [Gammaproteobacteria bacterium]